MPVILNDLANMQVAVKTYDPFFFDKKLTGRGKKTGVLAESANPAYVKYDATLTQTDVSDRKQKFTNGSTEVLIIPMSPITRDNWADINNWPAPDINRMAEVAVQRDIQTGTVMCKYYAYMEPHTVVHESTRVPQNYQTGAPGHISHKTRISYHVFLYCVPDGHTGDFAKCDLPASLINHTKPAAKFCEDYAVSPLRLLDNWLDNMNAQAVNGLSLDKNAAKDYVDKYSAYDGVCAQSEVWQTQMDAILERLFDNMLANNCQSDMLAMNRLAYLLRGLDRYSIPLDFYRKIYAAIASRFKTDIAQELYKQNLNLMLSDTLNSLDQNRANLTQLPPAAANTGVDSWYSLEQQRAITCTNPLVLVQSGAGTGKSSVILARMDWMVRAGVKPEDIMVLSFTNAAADHIKEKNPNVHSMTIASMIHNIYTTNFPGHDLSSMDTIINSIEIYYGRSDKVASHFQGLCKSIVKNETGCFVKMNSFVERHYDEVMKILDTIQQTSLELEIIICYQKIETLVEPPEVQSKYLIIDEVQDNSIFEFVYTIKYADKHFESLYLVGDCSQTLYEFRASDPKALNVLEGSGVFEAHKLQVNFRSNQEILDFANVLLQNIDANQYANIQLRANSMSNQVSEASFTEKVRFKYNAYKKLGGMRDDMKAIFLNILKPYIDECVAKGEQVAFLAYTRCDVAEMQSTLNEIYGQPVPPHNRPLTIGSLVPERQYNSTIMSDFIRLHWDEVKFMPQHDIINIIIRAIMDNVNDLVRNSNATFIVTKTLDKWDAENRQTINGWQAQFLAGQITETEMLDMIKHNMLQHEIRNNAIKQALLSTRNKENKELWAQQRPDLILSTIHSAKGLEFDNVVVLYKNDNQMDEQNKRMYYVAFTRAMHSEFIMAYGTDPKPRIAADYDAIVDMLHKKAPKFPLPNTAPKGTPVIANGQYFDKPEVSISELGPACMLVTANKHPDPDVILPPDSALTAALTAADTPAVSQPGQSQNAAQAAPVAQDDPVSEDDDPFIAPSNNSEEPY